MDSDAPDFTTVYGDLVSVCVSRETLWPMESIRGVDVRIATDGDGFRFRIPGDEITQMLIDGDCDGLRDILRGQLRLIDLDTYLVILAFKSVTVPRKVLAPALAEAYGLKPPPGAPKPAKR